MRKTDELQNGCMARAGSNEMTFVLLSRDIAAPATIRFWVNQRLREGKNKLADAQIQEALACADTMEAERGIHKPPVTDEDKVKAAHPEAEIRGGHHGKVWVDDGYGNMLSDVQCVGTREQRRAKAWAEAAGRVESIK